MSNADSKNWSAARPRSDDRVDTPKAQATDSPTTCHVPSFGPTWKNHDVAAATPAATSEERTTALRNEPRVDTAETNGIGARAARMP